MTPAVSPTPEPWVRIPEARACQHDDVRLLWRMSETPAAVECRDCHARWPVARPVPSPTPDEQAAEKEPCDHPYCGPLRCERHDGPAAVTAAEKAGRPDWAYDEDGYCIDPDCGNGRWKHHAPDCHIADLLDRLAASEAALVGRPPTPHPTQEQP